MHIITEPVWTPGHSENTSHSLRFIPCPHGSALRSPSLRRGRRQQLEVYEMEGRLSVSPSCRFPMFKELYWHTAEHYLGLLQAAALAGAPPPSPAPWRPQVLYDVKLQRRSSKLCYLRRCGARRSVCREAKRDADIRSC